MSEASENIEELRQQIKELQARIDQFESEREQGLDRPYDLYPNSLLKLYQQHCPLALVEVDREFRFRLWSRKAEEHFGWAAEEVIGKRWDQLEFVHVDDRERVAQVCGDLLSGSDDHNVCLNRNYHRNGEVLHSQWFTTAIPDEDGSIVSLLSFCLDISDRVEAEQALRESEARFTLAVGGTSLGVWEFDIESGHLYWSPQIYQLLGYQPREIVPSLELFLSLLHPDDLDATRRAVEASMATGEDYQRETRLRMRNGEYRWFHDKCAVELDQAGKPRRMAGCLEDIQSQKQSQFELAEAHRELNEFHLRQQIALDAGGVGVWEYDVRADRVFADDRLIQILGFDREAVAGGAPLATFVEAIHQDDRDRISGIFTHAPEQGGAYTIECRLRGDERSQPDGERWVVCRGNVEMDSTGQSVRAFGALVDISERRQAEDALAENEYRLRLIFDQQFQFTAILDPSGTVLDINNLALRAQGVQRTDYVGKPFWESPAWKGLPEWQKRIRENVLAATRSMQPIFSSDVYQTSDGDVRYADASYTAIRDERSLLKYVFVQAADVTDRKRAQDELEETRAILSAAIDASPAGIIVADAPDGRIRSVNSAAFEIRGGNQDELTNIPMEMHPSRWKCFYPDGTQYLPQDLPLSKAIIDGVVSKSVELIIERDDGQQQWVLANSAPVKNAEDQIVGGVVVFTDVTEQRNAAESLRVLEAKLAHVARVSTMGEMVGGIAHEINQPLYAIQNFGKASITSLESGRKVDQEQIIEWLHQITEAAEYAGAALVRLRNFVSRRPTQLRPVHLEEVVDNAISLTKHEADRKGIVITTRFSEGCPRVHADGVQLQQVVVNLVRNAIEAIPERFAVRQIDISAKTLDNELLVSVTDSGKGLPRDWEWQLFRAFSSTKPEGMGLGLAIARTIIESHGGELWASPDLETGAVFNFTLKVAE